jgi:hypothetical protein
MPVVSTTGCGPSCEAIRSKSRPVGEGAGAPTRLKPVAAFNTSTEVFALTEM